VQINHQLQSLDCKILWLDTQLSMLLHGLLLDGEEIQHLLMATMPEIIQILPTKPQKSSSLNYFNC